MKMFSVMVFWTKIPFKFKIQFLLWKLHLQYQKEKGVGVNVQKKNSDTILIAYIMSMFAKKRKG